MAQPVAFGTRSKQFVQSMKTIRRLIHGEIIRAVSFVAIGFLALFVFFDLVDQLQALSKNKYQGYQFQHALMYVGLLIPSHLYELLPISVLIGSIFVMARFAQSSEFTILRTGGLGPWRALGSLFQLGIGATFLRKVTKREVTWVINCRGWNFYLFTRFWLLAIFRELVNARCRNFNTINNEHCFKTCHEVNQDFRLSQNFLVVCW